MVVAASVNIALSACGLVILALVFWRLVAERRTLRGQERLLMAALLQGGALACKAGGIVPVLVGRKPIDLLSFLTLAFATCSVIMLAACLLTDADGHIRLCSRQTPLSPSLVGWAMGPSAIAATLDPLVGDIEILGMAYATSLCMVRLLSQRDHERELVRRELEVENAQSKVFAEQMSPHFLFNTLTSISSLCYSDPDAAAQAIADLSGYLRGNISALSSDDPVPFEQELSHIRQYIALEQADPARVFAMEYDLKAKPFSIPPLTVQPLVENAIKHGALSREDGLGRVRLSTEDRGRFVRVVVEDNGVGGNDTASEQEKTHDGVGLQSVERRLDVHGCSLRVSFGESGGWACVLVPREEERDGHAHHNR